MDGHTSAVLALKNAWSGAVDASDRMNALTASVLGLPEDAPLAPVDLETYHRLTLAQANAVMALRGLIEDVRRRQTAE
jgi:hypothetical protein